jgi:hypothetical protein
MTERELENLLEKLLELPKLEWVAKWIEKMSGLFNPMQEAVI